MLFVLVGVHPEHLQFSNNCEFLIVASEGRPGVNFESGLFEDPEGSITLFHLTGAGPTIAKHPISLQMFNVDP